MSSNVNETSTTCATLVQHKNNMQLQRIQGHGWDTRASLGVYDGAHRRSLLRDNATMMRASTVVSPLRRIPSLRTAGSVADRSRRSPSEITWSEEQQHKGRPLSPHVTIYKQPLPAISSITNRVSAVVLSLGFAGCSAVAAGGGDVSLLISTTLDTIPGATPMAKFLVAYPLTYHWMSGVRHQFWAWNPECIDLQVAPRTSTAIFLAAALMSGVASFVTIQGAVRVPSEVVKEL